MALLQVGLKWVRFRQISIQPKKCLPQWCDFRSKRNDIKSDDIVAFSEIKPFMDAGLSLFLRYDFTLALLLLYSLILMCSKIGEILAVGIEAFPA